MTVWKNSKTKKKRIVIGRTNVKILVYFNRHTRKAASMVTHSVQPLVTLWKEDISNDTEKMTV